MKLSIRVTHAENERLSTGRPKRFIAEWTGIPDDLDEEQGKPDWVGGWAACTEESSVRVGYMACMISGVVILTIPTPRNAQ